MKQNKDFEVAKILATLAGFLLLSSSFYGGYGQNTMGSMFNLMYNAPSLTDSGVGGSQIVILIDALGKLVIYNNWMQFILFTLGIILVIFSIYFLQKGYKLK